MTDWRTTLAEVSADRDAGSWALTRRAAPALAQAAVEGPAVLHSAIAQLLVGQPSMAALRNLANVAAGTSGTLTVNGTLIFSQRMLTCAVSSATGSIVYASHS